MKCVKTHRLLMNRDLTQLKNNQKSLLILYNLYVIFTFKTCNSVQVHVQYNIKNILIYMRTAAQSGELSSLLFHEGV